MSFQVREYVPDLAESIAGLILSSTDEEFQDECIALLGLGSEQDISEGAVQSSISEKMIRIIEMNDTRRMQRTTCLICSSARSWMEIASWTKKMEMKTWLSISSVVSPVL